MTGHTDTVKLWSIDNVLLHAVDLPVRGDVGCLCPSPKDDRLLAVAAGTSVIFYDLRNLSSALQVLSYSSDDINQINFHSSKPYICVCDDSGEIKVVSTLTYGLEGTLSGGHSNLCTCASFLPKMPQHIVSGGMDCKVVRWDWCKNMPLVEVVTLTDSSTAINPPMVYTLDVWEQNECVACGQGNGVVSVYELQGEGMKLKCTSSLHSSLVACVCCVDNEKSHVVSGGNDGKIAMSLLNGDHELVLASHVQHSSKINWISTDIAGNILVADQTNFVTLYKTRL